MLCILTVLVMCLTISTPVSAAVEISSKSITLTIGQKKQLKVRGTVKKVKWSSNKKKVAAVDQKGEVIAKSAGTAKITAKVGSKKYTCTVKVKKAAKISLNKTNITLNIGKSYALKLKNATGTVSWNTSDSKIAMIFPDGTVTGMKAGSCIVAAVYGGREYRCLVTVKQTSNNNTPVNPSVPVTGISLNYSNVVIDVGESKKITATVLPANATNKIVTWISSNNQVVIVDSVGNIKGVSFGIATITASCGGKKVTCIVNVKRKTDTVPYKIYGESTYRVGSTIPAGQYALFTTGSISGYFQISSDSTGSLSSIIANDNFDYNSIITVKTGQYLKLLRCKAIPIVHAKISPNVKGGMYRVGIDIKPGEYMLESTSSIRGYYEISSSDSHSLNDIVANDNFSGVAYITVENGQYLKLNRCKLSKYRES